MPRSENNWVCRSCSLLPVLKQCKATKKKLVFHGVVLLHCLEWLYYIILGQSFIKNPIQRALTGALALLPLRHHCFVTSQVQYCIASRVTQNVH